jgi:hypothetical protein
VLDICGDGVNVILSSNECSSICNSKELSNRNCGEKFQLLKAGG